MRLKFQARWCPFLMNSKFELPPGTISQPFSAGGSRASFSWRSRAVVLGVPVWCVVILVSVREIHLRVGGIYTAPTFSESVFQTFFVMVVHQHFLTPFIHWPGASEFDKYLQEWTNFQTRFRKVAGRPLLLSVRSLAVHRAAAVVGLPALITVVWSSDTNSGSTVYNVPLGFLAATFHAGVPALWDVVASAIVNGSESLRLSFAEVCAKS
ncbi:hypothetical protein ONE63_005178 [Megalurothrips usitatus]|uniref:Uncharacterized protein n=1 Tax=Megalurothrips usitatus TaxID=439358 RepID=A0AAV7Y1F6_9NEOP|nr:hypothetical protein ONE63_005178 [Megalurothrips usitatus]